MLIRKTVIAASIVLGAISLSATALAGRTRPITFEISTPNCAQVL